MSLADWCRTNEKKEQQQSTEWILCSIESREFVRLRAYASANDGDVAVSNAS